MNLLVIRSVYGKVGNTYFIQPCRNPKTGRYPTVDVKDPNGNMVPVDLVKKVDSNGDMILTDWERNSGQYFIAENETFSIVDGTTFDLDDYVDNAKWKSIEYCDWIAKDRFERDPHTGDLVIDGNARSYGKAVLYIERPGELTAKKVSKKRLVCQANTYIFDDIEKNKRMKAKLLGRNMDNAPLSDVEEFLTQFAEKDPKKIIELYEGEDWKMQVFILEAVERGVIRRKDGIYSYDDKVLGASIDSVIIFMRDITNRKLVASIKKETYPEFWTQKEIDDAKDEDILKGTSVEDAPAPSKKTKENIKLQ